ncbi:MAG TPA: hypothetical protein VF904_06860 [Anaeromyxobacteraceae bacterium]
MAWVLVAGVVLAFVLRFARRRRSVFTVLPSDSVSTMPLAMSKRQTAKTRAALDAATAALR